MRKIIAVECSIRSEGIVNIRFDSRVTFLDGDIVVIDPDYLRRFWSRAVSCSDGQLRLTTENGSGKVRQLYLRRSNEVRTLLRNGKVVFVFMSPVSSVLGEIANTRNYAPITNYDWLPVRKEFITGLMSAGRGSPVILKNPSHPVAPYYKAFKDKLSYEAYLETTSDDPDSFFLVNRTGNPVGYSTKAWQGLLVFVPYPPKDVYDSRLVNALLQCADPILTRDFRTPPPAPV